jgi:HK97 family phage prohead protease
MTKRNKDKSEPDVEFRRGFDFELRASALEEETLILEGHAAVFGQEAEICGLFIESISPGAFRKTLIERDQVALWDHDTGKPLARKSAGTLELSEDETGLAVVIRMSPDIEWQSGAYQSVKRGDVTGMSFGFEVVKQTWTEGKNGALDRRDIQEVRLYEVSPATIPAYEGTNLQARAKSIYEAHVEERNTCEPEEPHSEPEENHSVPEPEALEDEPEQDHSEAVKRIACASQNRKLRLQQMEIVR